MRTLILTHFIPEPIDSGDSYRIMDYANALRSAGHFVQFCVVPRDGMHKTQKDDVHIFRPKLSFNNISSGDAIVDWFCPPGFSDYVNNLVNKLNIKNVVGFYSFFSPILEALPKEIKKVIDVPFALSSRAKSDPLYRQLDREQTLLKPADMVTLCSEGQLMHENQHIIFPSFENKAPIGEEIDAMCFISSGNPYNQEGLNEFIQNVMGGVDKELHVYGNLKEIYPHPRVKYKGVTDRSDELLNQYKVTINPVFRGEGLKTKTGQALVSNTSLVTFDNGLIGFPESLFEFGVPDRNWREMQIRVNRLFQEPAYYTEMRHVQESWKKGLQKLNNYTPLLEYLK